MLLPIGASGSHLDNAAIPGPGGVIAGKVVVAPLLRPPGYGQLDEATAVASALAAARLRLVGAEGKNLKERRAYLGDPHRYFRDRLKWALTPQQESVLDLVMRSDRVLVPAGNGVGKTFFMGGVGLYFFEIESSRYDEERGYEEQGCRLLLIGPDSKTVFSTIYSEMMAQASRAEQASFSMPGERSERSVQWVVRPMWSVESFNPPRRVKENVRHTVSGRHHKNQIAIVEEAQGVDEATWRAVEGMCSSRGNKIISAFNPTEPAGAVYQRAQDGGYDVLHLDAFDHPNVKQRQWVVPEAISYLVVDDRVRTQCQNRGPIPGAVPDPEFDDFLYSLPPERGAAEGGPRADEIRGHAGGEIRVFRPSATFQAQVRGRWPRTLESGLVNPADWDMSTARWRALPLPSAVADQVAIDLAREGGAEIVAVPRWGENPELLLRRFSKAQRAGQLAEMKRIQDVSQLYVGLPFVLQRGDGPSVARQIYRLYQRSPIVVDAAGVGASVYDHLRHVLNVSAEGLSFAASAPEPADGEPYTENLRAFMYVRMARLVQLGLVAVPSDPLLREEIMATEVIYVRKVVTTPEGNKQSVLSIRIQDKEEISRKLGRSPDRADAFVMSLYQGRPVVKAKPQREVRW